VQRWQRGQEIHNDNHRRDPAIYEKTLKRPGSWNGIHLSQESVHVVSSYYAGSWLPLADTATRLPSSVTAAELPITMSGTDVIFRICGIWDSALREGC
jgi:hypothetical protein